jgi:sialate O-acetylesterase
MTRFILRSAVLCLSLLAALVAAEPAVQDVKLAAIFGDRMVLQSGMEIRIWGWAGPGQEVTVDLNGVKASGKAGPDGAWKVGLPPQKDGTNLELRVISPGKPDVICRDVSIGEVWLCSGQSNMAYSMPLAGNEEIFEQADYPHIRYFSVRNATAAEPATNLAGSWVVCTPRTAPGFSGTAFCFGRDLHLARRVPVGLICSAVGGTVAEAWMSSETLASTPALKSLAAAQELRRKDEAINAPSALYNGMIAPLTRLAIRGVLWYQGENNAWRDHPGADYRVLFPALITDWRARWGKPDLPFLYVQLPNWTPPVGDPNTESKWGEIREAQASALVLPNTAMAVMIDSGDTRDIHPPNKKPFGHRLALAARGLVYGEPVLWKSPLYHGMRIEGDSIRITFSNTNSPLVVKNGERPKWFAIAGQDKRFVWAEARLEGNTIVVRSDQVPEPAAVRYAWWMNPLGVNVFSEAGFPLAPFRTDTGE